MSKHKHHRKTAVTHALDVAEARHLHNQQVTLTEDEAKLLPAAEYLKWRLNQRLNNRPCVEPYAAWTHRLELERTIARAHNDYQRHLARAIGATA